MRRLIKVSQMGLFGHQKGSKRHACKDLMARTQVISNHLPTSYTGWNRKPSPYFSLLTSFFNSGHACMVHVAYKTLTSKINSLRIATSAKVQWPVHSVTLLRDEKQDSKEGDTSSLIYLFVLLPSFSLPPGVPHFLLASLKCRTFCYRTSVDCPFHRLCLLHDA